MQKTRFNQNASLMEKRKLFETLSWKKKGKEIWLGCIFQCPSYYLAKIWWYYFSNLVFILLVGSVEFVEQPFLCELWSILGLNWSWSNFPPLRAAPTVSQTRLCLFLFLCIFLCICICLFLVNWIDPGPIFHPGKQTRVSQTRQTYCSSYQSTDLPSFNKISFQFQPFPISTRAPRDVRTLLIANCLPIFWGALLFNVWYWSYFVHSKFWRRKVFLWIWWGFSSVTSWIDWTNLILYWNSKNFQVLEWNSILNGKWCDTFFLFCFNHRGGSHRKETYPNFQSCHGISTSEKKGGTYFPFQIFKKFLKVQALKEAQVGAWKSKTGFFSVHIKRDIWWKGDIWNN